MRGRPCAAAGLVLALALVLVQRADVAEGRDVHSKKAPHHHKHHADKPATKQSDVLDYISQLHPSPTQPDAPGDMTHGSVSDSVQFAVQAQHKVRTGDDAPTGSGEPGQAEVKPEDQPRTLTMPERSSVEGEEVPGYRKVARTGCLNIDTIRQKVLTDISMRDCSWACDADSECSGFLFGVEGDVVRSCTLLNDGCDRYDDANYHMFVDNFQVNGYSKIGRQGCSNLRAIMLVEAPDVKAMECGVRCDDAPDCTGFTFKVDGGVCTTYSDGCQRALQEGTHHYFKAWKQRAVAPDCKDKDDELKALATSRGFANLDSCARLVTKFKSMGKGCDSPLSIFGMLDKTVASVCCGSCAHPCVDHDAVIADVMDRRGYPELNSCEKAVPMLKEVGLRVDADLEAYELPRLTVSDVCCRSAANPELVWQQPLRDPYEDYEDYDEVSPKDKAYDPHDYEARPPIPVPGTPDAQPVVPHHSYRLPPSLANHSANVSFRFPANHTRNHTRSFGDDWVIDHRDDAPNPADQPQFPNDPEGQRQQEMKDVAATVQSIRNQKRLERLTMSIEKLVNTSDRIEATVKPRITVGNRTLNESQTTEFGQGYNTGFFLGYKTGFMLAAKDDLAKPVKYEKDEADTVMTLGDPDEYAIRGRSPTGKKVDAETTMWQVGQAAGPLGAPSGSGELPGFEEARVEAMAHVHAVESGDEEEPEGSSRMPQLFSMKERNQT